MKGVSALVPMRADPLQIAVGERFMPMAACRLCPRTPCRWWQSMLAMIVGSSGLPPSAARDVVQGCQHAEVSATGTPPGLLF